MMHSAGALLRTAGKCTGKGAGATVQMLTASPAASCAAQSGALPGNTAHTAVGFATRCVTQLKAGPNSSTMNSAAQGAMRGQSMATACSGSRLHTSAASSAASSARSRHAGSWAAGAAQQVRAAVRPAAQLLSSELRAIFQPEHALQHVQAACTAGSGTAGAAAGRAMRAYSSMAAAMPAAMQNPAAAAKRVLRPLQPPRLALSRSSTAAAACASSKQAWRGVVASSRMLSSAACAARRRGAQAAGAAARQQARAYNGYSRGSHQSPWASVTLGRGLNPMHALYGVIGLNVAVFFLWQTNPQFAARNFMVSPQHLRDGRVHTLLTSAFSHAELSHLAVNMITLYFFGQEIALLFGPQLFLGLYCTAGIAASLSHVAWFWYKAVSEGGAGYMKDARLRRSPPALGASGAVSAIVIADVLLNPWRSVIVFPIPIPMPAALLGVFWVASDVSGSIRGTGTVGHVAHLGGAATGAAFYWAWRRGLLRRRW